LVWLVAMCSLGACHRGEHPDAKAAQVARVHVDSVVIDERPVPRSVTVTGTLEADQRTDLAANASGRVIRTFVERGDHVRAGALLAQLDSRGALLSRASAQADAKSIGDQLAAVRTECARYEVLRAQDAIPQQQYDRQTAQCRTQASAEEAARARVAEAARVVRDAAIRAPFAGVVGERFVSVGDYVEPRSKVVTLLVDDPLRLRISVPEPAIPFAREGTAITFKLSVYPDREFSARIKYLGREVRPTTRDMIDEAVLDNHDHLLLPGTFVTVQLPAGVVTEAAVPASALVNTDSGPTVFAIVDRRLEQRAVHTDVSLVDGIAVSEGLKKGDRVVDHPVPDLKDGSPVE
jgi:membrane fusion protein (multidrug efflux system)